MLEEKPGRLDSIRYSNNDVSRFVINKLQQYFIRNLYQVLELFHTLYVDKHNSCKKLIFCKIRGDSSRDEFVVDFIETHSELRSPGNITSSLSGPGCIKLLATF